MELVNKYEKCVYLVLIFIIAALVAFSLLDLTALIIYDIISPPIFLLQNPELLDILGFILLVLIGIELLDTIKAYLQENVIHFEIVILLAIVAVARKVILLDPAVAPGTEYAGIGILIIGLAGGYYLIKKAGFTTPGTVEQKPPL